MNEEEADYISKIIKAAVDSGMSIDNMAVIMPYRRQVKTIREYLHKDEYLGPDAKQPLIDTVERLQGQDVDLIIISTCVTDPVYFNANRGFLTNPNRLNVMFSRAKKKVIFLRKEQLWSKEMAIRTCTSKNYSITCHSLSEPLMTTPFNKTVEKAIELA